MSNQDYTEQYLMPPEPIKWGESISSRTIQALKDLGWKDPNEVQKEIAELGESRLTMLVNFGPKGKCKPGLVDPEDKLNVMIIKVFSYYEDMYIRRKYD